MTTVSVDIDRDKKNNYTLVIVTTEQDRIDIPITKEQASKLEQAGIDIFLS